MDKQSIDFKERFKGRTSVISKDGIIGIIKQGGAPIDKSSIKAETTSTVSMRESDYQNSSNVNQNHSSYHPHLRLSSQREISTISHDMPNAKFNGEYSVRNGGNMPSNMYEANPGTGRYRWEALDQGNLAASTRLDYNPENFERRQGRQNTLRASSQDRPPMYQFGNMAYSHEPTPKQGTKVVVPYSIQGLLNEVNGNKPFELPRTLNGHGKSGAYKTDPEQYVRLKDVLITSSNNVLNDFNRQAGHPQINYDTPAVDVSPGLRRGFMSKRTEGNESPQLNGMGPYLQNLTGRSDGKRNPIRPPIQRPQEQPVLEELELEKFEKANRRYITQVQERGMKV
eukprot:TRINITY_DN3829_c0_g1_i1.p1 TRINITY_DN3829_c0_g1~~TRINITY_DN3829_c0_g1_i1.p1  ORF type:complete len:340 (-),score=39.57 TRINITY_DN3829_c0_g1_i1:40-1059(-)